MVSQFINNEIDDQLKVAKGDLAELAHLLNKEENLKHRVKDLKAGTAQRMAIEDELRTCSTRISDLEKEVGIEVSDEIRTQLKKEDTKN